MPNSTATVGTPVTPAAVGRAANFTSANGNGHSEVVAESGSIGQSFGGSTAVVTYTGNGDFGLTTGYIQSDTAGRGVVRVTTNQVFTYNGTEATLVSLTAATNANVLRIDAPSVSMTSGTLTGLGVGSTALLVKATGGAALGDIDVTVDGDVSGAKRGIALEQTNTATNGNINLTSMAGNSITGGAGNGVTILAKGSGSITVDLAGSVSGTLDGISAVTKGGAITMTVANVTTVSAEAIDARQSNAAGAGAISITSTGDVTGTTGIRALNAGTGPVALMVSSGRVTGSGNDAIHITSSNASAGATDVTTASGAVISANNGDGIDVDQQGIGDVHVINNATINSGAAVNKLLDGIDVNDFGTGNVTIENNGAIGASGDRAQATAINGAINNIAASGDVSISGTGDIFAVNEGIDVFISGSGFAFVAYDGDIDTTAGPGIQIDTKSGTITATTGGAINAGGHGIDTTSTTGDQVITVNGAVGSRLDGVNARATSGTITVNINGGNVTGVDDALDLSSNGAKTVNVAAGRTLSGGDGIFSTGTGITTINNSGTITSTEVTILSTTSSTTVNNLAGGTVDGAITLSGLNDSVINNGTLAGALTLAGGADLYDGRNGSISGTVNGGDGNDTLRGGAGAETMIGGLGADILEGNGGSDNLTGGADNDTFRGTASGLNSDRVMDFAAGDKIVITDANLNGFSFSLNGNTLTYTGGSLTLTGFTGQLQASAAAGEGVQLTVGQTAAAAIPAGDFKGDWRDDLLWQDHSRAGTNWLDRTNGGFVANADWDTVAAPNWHVPPDLII